jgi:putative nucleotidyltransferase with HDIG domain
MWSPPNGQPPSKPRRAWRNVRVWLLGALFVLGTSAILIVPLFTAGQVTLNVGDVAPADVSAPHSAHYASEILTEQARDDAERSVPIQYDPLDPRVARQQVARARQVIDFIRAVRLDSRATRDQRRSALAAIEHVSLSPATIDRLLDLPDDQWQRLAQEIITVIDLAMRSEIRDANLSEVKARVPALVAFELNDDQTALVSEVAQNFIVENRARNDAATALARSEARSQVEPRMRDIEAGQIIIRQGEVVNSQQIEALNQLNLRQSQVNVGDISGTLLAALVSAVLLGVYLWRFEAELIDRPRSLLLLLLVLLIFLITAKLVVPNRTILPFLFPAAALSMLLAVLLGPGLAVTATLVMAGLVGIMGDRSIEMTIYAAAGGTIAVMALGKVERFSAFFRAGLYVALINVAVILAFRLPDRTTDAIGLLSLIAVATANGGLSASLALGGLFLVGNLFDITTTLQLLELARPTHPLLNELLRQSPGTYHHTLMVANLAEQAAERIGANSLLTRVGAFYHDVGKTVRPYMFVENQVEGSNVHDQLNPRTSAEIIISHVTDGMKLAKRYRLPTRVRAFIPEHHGTMRVSLLYQKAIEQSPQGAASVDEAAFRYPGPRPQSKETALLMLADGCEAAVRATRPDSPEEVNEIVQKVIADRIAWGQLDECPLTLADLNIARESFVATLQGMFHPRLLYPGQEQKTDPALRAIKANGPSVSQPTPLSGVQAASESADSGRQAARSKEQGSTSDAS